MRSYSFQILLMYISRSSKLSHRKRNLNLLMFLTMLNICMSSFSLPLSSVTVRLNRLISTGQVEQSYKCSYFKQCSIIDISLLYHVGSYMSGLALLSRCASEDISEHGVSAFFLVQLKILCHFLINPPLMQSQLCGFGVYTYIIRYTL